MNIIEDLDRKLDQLTKNPTNSCILNDIGVLLYRVNDWENAEKYFHRAYELDSKNGDILFNYALILYKQDKFREAIFIYEAYLKFYEYDKEVIQKLGDCYFMIGEYGLASKMYKLLQRDREGNH
ncbi:hypothetical protein DW1_1586 [Proteiniborus sp. DW1]|uniref:tetratricopeptide repeat protein n=1 Tax=Proteiniborus sp. DW1 TaxID=1889883 RepID=UPI00092E0A13|nr:tetratricopeptide repeat protein [Proteiniborus sp. DW1]SCG83156.1 hypothetical protein DW1_1586 [Proteiniborus sp. DW1]